MKQFKPNHFYFLISCPVVKRSLYFGVVFIFSFLFFISDFQLQQVSTSINKYLGISKVSATTESIALVKQSCAGEILPCYTSLASWESAYGGINFGACAVGDLVCADKIAIAQIDGVWTNPDTTAVTIDGWTTGPNNYIRIYTTAAARHDGKWNTGKYRLEISGATALYILEDYVHIEGLQVALTTANYGIRTGTLTSGSSETRISYNIVKGGSYGIIVSPTVSGTAGNVFKIWNNIAYNCTAGGFYTNDGTTIWYNNTSYGNTSYGFRTGSGLEALYIKNNISYNNGDNYLIYILTSGSNNLSGPTQTDAPGTNPRNGVTVTFVDETNKDFHLASNDAGALSYGINLYNDASLAFQDDIDRNDRGGSGATWDIGANEYVNGAPTPYCGDGSCNGTETCSTCPSDCGACPDTTPPSTPTNLTATAISSSQINLSWTASTDNVGVTGYRIYRCAGADCTPTTNIIITTNTTFSNTSLIASTTYTYAVSAYDAAGNESGQSNLVSATTQAVPSFNYVMGTGICNIPVPQPAQWETYTDPCTNIQIRRISNASDIGAAGVMIDYGRKTRLSSDGRYLLVFASAPHRPYWIYDLVNRTVREAPFWRTGGVYANNAGFDAQPDYRWDTSGEHPTWIYYRDGLGFYRGDVTYPAGNSTSSSHNVLVHNFANEFPTADIIEIEEYKEGSLGSRYWGFKVQESGLGTVAIITYDKETDTILGRIDNPPGGVRAGVGITPDGTKAWVGSDAGNGGAGSNFDGAHAWNINLTTTPAPVRLARTSGHHGHAFDTNGNGGYFQSGGGLGAGDGLWWTNYNTGEYFRIIPNVNIGWGVGVCLGHFYSPAFKGWGLVDTYSGSVATEWAAHTIFMIEIKPISQSPRIWRIAQTQNTYTDYRSQSNAVIDVLGTKIYFGSNWRNTDNMEVYEATLPSTWVADLAGLTLPDTTPPTRSGGSPTGTLLAGTTSTTLSLTTNESAICRYSTIAGTSYSLMTNIFSTTEGANHSNTVSGLTNGTTYNYYIRCRDIAGNPNTDDYTITFSVASPVTDTTSPSAITNLSTSNITQTSVDLDWTSPGDDGSTGTAASYDIRYSTSNITESNWSSATQVTGEPTPLVAGTNQSYTVVILSPSTTYYFAIKTRDEVLNWSSLSNIPSVTTQSLGLMVSISADPNSGTGSLSGVDLAAAVSGTQTGNINYTFYCNRSDSGTNITLPYDAKYDNVSQTTRTATNLCNYSSAGTYTAKVIVERGAMQTENRTTIIVSSTPGGGGGGGGGGGYFIDTTPPSQPDDFESQGADKQISLTWNNPDDNDFVRVVILRTTTTISAGEVYSSLIKKAEVVYEGTAQEFIDTNLDNAKTYYYAIYAYDRKPNYTQPVIISAQPKEGVIQITTPTPTPTPTLIFTKTLYLELRDEEVKKLQELLFKEKLYFGKIRGYFGSLTQKAVQNFQCKHNIVCSGSPQTTGYGVVGPKTRAKLNELLSKQVPTPEKETLIKELQEKIRTLQLQIINLLNQIIQLLQKKLP